MLLCVPDAIYSPSQISGSLFLYFFDKKIGFASHPTISLPLTGIDPFDFMRFSKKRKPKWFKDFESVFSLSLGHLFGVQETYDIIKPLKNDAFDLIWYSYPRDNVALDRSKSIIESTKLPYDKVYELINPIAASDELISHFRFEKFIELYKPEINTSNEMKKLPDGFDYSLLFEYCNDIFSKESLKELLCKAYFFRYSLLNSNHELILNNQKLFDFLSIESDDDSQIDETKILDIISWEVFKRILSDYCDEITPDTVKMIKNLRDKRRGEILELKSKCYNLAGDFYGETDFEKLKSKISWHVKTKVQKEITELLALDRESMNEYLISVFSDEKTWIAISSFIISLFTHDSVLTAGTAIACFSSLGAKAVKTATNRYKRIKQSDYALVYRINNMMKNSLFK